MPHHTPRVVYEPVAEELSLIAPQAGAADALSAVSSREGAEAALRRVLADGPLPGAEVYARLEALGFSAGTVRRAKEALSVVSRPRESNGPWHWTLPSDRGPQDAAA